MSITIKQILIVMAFIVMWAMAAHSIQKNDNLRAEQERSYLIERLACLHGERACN